MKISVVAVEVLMKKERQDETQFTTKMGGKTSLGPSYFALYFHSQLHIWVCFPHVAKVRTSIVVELKCVSQ